MKLFLTIIFTFCLGYISSAQNQPHLIRYPSINNDGTEIAFSFQGDIWVMDSNGQNSRRLTIHEGYDGYPQWSPDGKSIGFSSNRFGNYDVFTIDAKGGVPKRLTYHSANDIINGWYGNNIITFATSRLFRQVERSMEVFEVSVNGGTPTRVLSSLGGSAVKSPDGRYYAFERGTCRIAREDYRGPAQRDIWLYDLRDDKYIQITTDEGNDFQPRWFGNNTLYFVSSQTGRYNIFKVSIDTTGSKFGKPQQVTFFKEDGVRYFSVSNQSKKIVLERQDKIFISNIGSKEVNEINPQINTDYRFDPIEHKTYSSRGSEYKVSPNGKLLAYDVRGEIFVKENNPKKKRSINISKHPYRDMNVDWLNDSTLIFVSDRFGQKDLFIAFSSDKNETNIFKSFKHKIKRLTETDVDESWPVISHEHDKIAYEEGYGKLLVADINSEGEISNRITLLDGWDSPGNVSWSPDDKWLAYSLSDLNFNSEIFIHASDNSRKPVNVSMHPRGDYSPVWSPDGSKLGFNSVRSNNSSDVWFVWLNKKDWQKTNQDWEESSDKPNKGKGNKSKKSKKTKPIKIDFEKIYERLVHVTTLPGDERGLAISKDGEKFYFTALNPTKKGNDLYSIKWDGTGIKQITKDGANPFAISLGPDGKQLYMVKRGQLMRVSTSSSKIERLPFAAKMDINYEKENEQIFEEAWRALSYRFYDPEFHGKDWNALKNKFKPWALSASTKKDFADIFNFMLGQLNASHMGLYSSGREETQKERTGLLGIEIAPQAAGVKVISVLKDSPADKINSRLNVGDIILTVNGNPVNEKINFYSLLVNESNEKILLSVKKSGGETKDIYIRPSNSLRQELYNDWVETRRSLVNKYSNNRLGYLHIRAMGWSSFERFERELTAAGYGKEGIVVDVRYNGGGWTTDYLMAILNVKQHAYTIPRGAASSLKDHLKFKNNYPFGERLPFSIWNKPSIAICNQSSYSNAEIFSHAYKTLNIGKLVGMPTFGAVISTGAQGLIDGSRVRIPFRAWFVKATEENMEHGPAVPDIIIENTPDAKAKGRDEQLKMAVEELLIQIDNK